MPLTVGDRFAGHFEVTGVLGAGGMGEVYRASDTRLNRDVALKLLPDAFAADADRLTRFQREAEVLASLNHPNVAQIYGIEEDGGVRALVLELVDGPTLEARIARGPVPPDEVLAIATQLADGLEAAHEAGVVHRDLKPANIKVQPDGTVKVLDFGLAKALEAATPGDRHGPSTWSSAGTGVGVVVGTAAYMSPEQARGRAVDRRTDVWAFGAVLFEMLTGRRAFEGEDAAGIFAEVLKAEPAWETLPGDVAPAVSAVLRRCLEKEPLQRMRDIADVRLGLHGAFDDAEGPAAGASAGRSSGWTRRVLELVGVAAVAGLGVWFLQPAAPRQPVQFAIQGASGLGPFAEMSPDGGQLAYLEAGEAGESRILIHSLASGEARQVSDSARAGTPLFWSPDSRFVGFADGRTLRRVDVATGEAEPVSDTPVFNGGAWNGDDVILFGGRDGIMQVAAGGGTPAAVTAVDAARGEITHAAPWFLPDDRHFLYLRASLDSSTGGIYVGRLGVDPAEQDPTRLLATERPAVYAPSRGATTGRLFFMRGSRLLAQPFDDARLELAGDPTVVAEDVASYDVRWRSFSVSRTGVIAWRDAPSAYSVPWLDSDGRVAAEPIGGLEDPRHPRLSPDGSRLALVVAGDIWAFDLHGDRPPNRLTFDESSDAIGSPLWTPDGEGIVYEGDGSLYRVSADGGSPPEPIGAPGHFHALAWSPDGKLIGVAISGESGDLVELSLSPAAEPRALVRTTANEGTAAALSPDGRWLAYTSDATGRREIWVRGYPGPGAPVRVSHDGGVEPVWARDGRTLYYLDGRTMMAAAVSTSAGLDLEAPVRLFDGDFRVHERPPSYDVDADGRFVTTRSDAAPSISVLLNWPEALRSRGDGQ